MQHGKGVRAQGRLVREQWLQLELLPSWCMPQAPRERRGYVALSDSPPSLGTPRTHGLCSNCAQLWPPENAGVMEPFLISSPLLGTPKNAGVTQHFRPPVGPREGKGCIATSDFFSFAGTAGTAENTGVI